MLEGMISSEKLQIPAKVINLPCQAETEWKSVLGEAPRWHARGDVPRYNECERDKIR